MTAGVHRFRVNRNEPFAHRAVTVLLAFVEIECVYVEAQADRAVFATDSEDATLSGSIQIYSHEEQASLQAGRLSWVREGRRLIADDGQTVRVQTDEGSYVEGEGFSADFRRKRLEFSSRVRGSYIQEEEEQE